MDVSGGVATAAPPLPKSPPGYPDLYGNRRELDKVQMLEKDVCFLEEELIFLEGHRPASQCCKEIVDFVAANSDPLISTNRRSRRSCDFWKWLCGCSWLNVSWICCFNGCSPCLQISCDCHCKLPKWCSCFGCSKLKCNCAPLPKPAFPCSSSSCCSCFLQSSSCNCSKFTCGVPKCLKVCKCCSCKKNCCFPCYLCY